MTCPFFNGIIDKHMCKLKFRVARVHLNLEKEEPVYENDISAENKTEKEGTWIPQENENREEDKEVEKFYPHRDRTCGLLFQDG